MHIVIIGTLYNTHWVWIECVWPTRYFNLWNRIRDVLVASVDSTHSALGAGLNAFSLWWRILIAHTYTYNIHVDSQHICVEFLYDMNLYKQMFSATIVEYIWVYLSVSVLLCNQSCFFSPSTVSFRSIKKYTLLTSHIFVPRLDILETIRTYSFVSS